MKTNVIEDIMMRLSKYVDKEDLYNFKMELVLALEHYDISKQETGLSTYVDDNDYQILLFEKVLEAQRKSERTIYSYSNSTKNFLRYINKNFRDVTTDDIYIYLAKKTMVDRVSTNSLDNERKFVKAFFKYASSRSLLPNGNPFDGVDSIKRTDKEIITLDSIEIGRLREACRDIKEIALLDFLISTGVRVSECSYAERRNVDFENRTVQIYGHKTGKWRCVFLNDLAAESLKKYFQYVDDNTEYKENKYIFYQDRGDHLRMTSYCINSIVSELAERINLEKECTVHTFRRTLGSNLAENGMSLKKIASILGNSVGVLEKHYIKISDKSIQNEYNAYFRDMCKRINVENCS